MDGKRTILAGLSLAAALFWLSCGGASRPAELIKADRLMQDQISSKQAARAAPKLFKASQRYYKLAEKAFKRRKTDDCIHFSTMAAMKFATAMERAKKMAAKERHAKADQRLRTARAAHREYDGRRAEADKRINRMEKILALQKDTAALQQAREKAKAELEAQKKASAERLAAEKAKQQVHELMASASSKLQAAEALEAKKYDPINLNSAKTFLKQAKKALREKRFTDALDLAKMAEEKSKLASSKAQAEYAKKSKETERLKERERLFSEANNIQGLQVRQEQRGVVLSLHKMFAARKAIVLPDRAFLLDKIAKLAKHYPAYPIVVEGYTDSRGRDADNLALSQSRAQSVLDYLVQQKKIEFSRIKSSGYGEANPIADNSTFDGRAKNRRIEVIFLFR